MELGIQVRAAVDCDVPQIARLHVESWRETYRGLMADSVLDDPDFISRRERFWTAVLTDPIYRANWIAIVEGLLIGIAMARPVTERLPGRVTVSKADHFSGSCDLPKRQRRTIRISRTPSSILSVPSGGSGACDKWVVLAG
jgi:hypothetical protein